MNLQRLPLDIGVLSRVFLDGMDKHTFRRARRTSISHRGWMVEMFIVSLIQYLELLTSITNSPDWSGHRSQVIDPVTPRTRMSPDKSHLHLIFSCIIFKCLIVYSIRQHLHVWVCAIYLCSLMWWRIMRLHHLPKVMALMKRVQREFHPYQNTSPTTANRR